MIVWVSTEEGFYITLELFRWYDSLHWHANNNIYAKVKNFVSEETDSEREINTEQGKHTNYHASHG